MRPMMLHRHAATRLLQSVFGREVFRVQIVSDDLWFRLVKTRQIRDGACEGVVRRLRRQIADVLTNEQIRPYAERDRVLEMRSDGKNRPLRLT